MRRCVFLSESVCLTVGQDSVDWLQPSEECHGLEAGVAVEHFIQNHAELPNGGGARSVGVVTEVLWGYVIAGTCSSHTQRITSQ